MEEDSKEIRTMRTMAWERAKGELKSILQTYCDISPNYENYHEFDIRLSEFINYIEDEELTR